VNLAIRSQEFNTWSQTRVTVTQDSATAPDGTVTADKLIATTDANTHFLQRVVSGITSGATHTVSVFAKAGEYGFVRVEMGNNSAGAYFNLTNGTVVSQSGSAVGSIQPFEDGWYRCVVTVMSIATSFNYVVAPSPNGTSINYTGDGTSGIFIWGAQLETGSVATSYIKTEGSAQTRNADVITDDLPLPQTSGIFTATLSNRLITGTRTIATLRGASTTWPVELRNNRFGFRDVVQGADTTAGTHRVSVWWSDSGATYRLYVDGALIGTEQTGATPISGTIGTFDYGMNNSTNWLNDALSEIAVISGGTPSQAQTLSTL
jgi:hypothetical protein